MEKKLLGDTTRNVLLIDGFTNGKVEQIWQIRYASKIKNKINIIDEKAYLSVI